MFQADYSIIATLLYGYRSPHIDLKLFAAYHA
jgi:hypothetical protein